MEMSPAGPGSRSMHLASTTEAAAPPGDGVPGPAGGAPARGASVHLHLLLLVLGVILPLLAFAGIAMARFAEAERSRIEQNARATAGAVAAALDRDFAALIATAQVLAGSLALREGDLEGFHRQALAATAVLQSVVTLRDPASRQLVNTNIPRGEPLPDRTMLAAADAEVARTGGPVVSNLFRALTNPRPEFAVVVPDAVGGAAGHFLSLSVPTDRVQRLLMQVRLGEGEVAGVLDRDGIFVARTRDAEAAVGTSPTFRAPGGTPAGTRMGTDRAGQPALLAFQRSTLSDWRVGITVPETILATPLRTGLQWLAAVGGATLALAVLAALMIGRRIGTAVQALADFAAGLREDRPLPALATPLREVNQVSAALAAATAGHRAQQVARRLGEERLRVALSNAPIVAYSWDRELRYTWIANPHADYPADTVLGRRDDELVPPEDLPQAFELMALKRRVMSTGEGARQAMRWRRRDGTWQHFDLTAEPLRDAAGRIDGGVMAALDITGPVRAAEERAALLERLDAERGRLAAVFEAAPVALVIAEAPTGRILAGNRMVDAILGHPIRPSAGWEHYGEWNARHPDGSEVQPAEFPLARAIRGQEERPEAVMLYGDRPDGREVWIKVVAAPVRDAEGGVTGAVVAVMDIDAEQRAIAALSRQEAQQRLLINELNHRVKNTLAIVLSMASQTLRHATGLEDARRRLQDRLLALSAAHDVLTRTSWEGAMLDAVLEVALAPHRAAWGAGEDHIQDRGQDRGPGRAQDRIETSGPDLWLPPRIALALSMAFHELATNAVKYGALSTEGGRLAVTWQVDAGGRLHLAWTESGGPPVLPRPSAASAPAWWSAAWRRTSAAR